MFAKYFIASSFVCIVAVAAGCNSQHPFMLAPLANANPQQANWEQQQASRMQDLGRRASALDVDNRDLHTQIAQANQQIKLIADENKLLRRQLKDTATQLRQNEVAKVQANQQLSEIEAHATQRGSTRITANNSLKASLPVIDIPGIQVRPDGDVIHVELPADRLFHQGTSQLLPAAATLLDQIAGIAARNYPRQKIGIEGHADALPTGATSSHQLTVAQANAVFATLTTRSRFPAEQLSITGHGANQPVVSNATPAGRSRNRRVEIVIYPETVDAAP